MVLRTQDGKPTYEGEQIQIGGNETYIPVCRKHYFHQKLKNYPNFENEMRSDCKLSICIELNLPMTLCQFS